MKKLRIIGLGLLGVILLGGCTLDVAKKADRVCGETPTMPVSADATLNDIENLRQNYFEILSAQPVSFLECRAGYHDRPASYVLGMEYIEGERVSRNFKKAAELFELAGKPESGNRVYYVPGIGGSSGYTASYNTGQGTPGMVEAQYQLGLLYLEGLGVPQSFGKAKKWLKRASRQGHQEATGLLKEIEGENNA